MHSHHDHNSVADCKTILYALGEAAGNFYGTVEFCTTFLGKFLPKNYSLGISICLGAGSFYGGYMTHSITAQMNQKVMEFNPAALEEKTSPESYPLKIKE